MTKWKSAYSDSAELYIAEFLSKNLIFIFFFKKLILKPVTVTI